MSDPSPSITASDAKRAARNVGALMAASVISKGLLFAWQIALGNFLGPTEYGIFNTIIGLMGIAAVVVGFGIGVISIREVANKPEKIGQYAATMLFLQSSFAGIGYIGAVIGSLTLGDSAITAFTAIAAISLIIDMFGNIGNDLLLAQERMVISSVVDITHIVLRVALAAGALYIGWGLLGVYLATIVSGMIRSSLFWLIHLHNGLYPIWPLEREITFSLLRDALPIALTGLLSQAYAHADKLMTTGLIDVTSTGFLGLAGLIHFGISELLSTQLMLAMYPMMARYYDADKTETFGFIVEKLARFTLILVLPIALVLTIFASTVILLIYKPDFIPAIGILQIYVWFSLFVVVRAVFSRALLVQNKQSYTLRVLVLSLSLNIGLNTAFLLLYRDPRGVAVASVATEGLTLLLLAWAFRAKGFDWQRVLQQTLRILVVGALAAGAMLAGGLIHPSIGMALGGITYLVGIIYGGALSEADWDLLYRLVAAMPGGNVILRYWKRDTAINW
jgi:O-antigen/teichoic acid export membrane protein